MLLREDIIEGNFKFGEALSESKVANRYGVSRTPVREAFSFLGKEGLVRTEPQLGTYVFTINREDFGKLSEVRSILEVAALSAAMVDRRKALLRGWRKIVKNMEAAISKGSAAEYVCLDRKFHAILFDIADNFYLSEATFSFAAKMAAIQNRMGETKDHIAFSCAEHVELLALVEDKRDEVAKVLLDRHIRHKGEAFWKAAETQFTVGQPTSVPSEVEH